MSTAQQEFAELIWQHLKDNPAKTVHEMNAYFGKQTDTYLRNLYLARALDRTSEQKPCDNHIGYVRHYRYSTVGDKFPGYRIMPPLKVKAKAVKVVKAPTLAPVQPKSETYQTVYNHTKAVLDQYGRSPATNKFLDVLYTLPVKDVIAVRAAINELLSA